MMTETFLTVQQAADRLGIDPVGIRFRFIYGTLTRYHRSEVPARFHQPKCRWYVAQSEIDNPQSAAERQGWITSKEAAKILGVAEPTIAYYVRTGRLTPLHLPSVCARKGWKCYFDPEAVEKARDNRPPRVERQCRFEATDADCAYMAGIVDGEGSILIARRSSPSCKDRVYHHVGLQIANTSSVLMEWLVRHFGGRCTRTSTATGTHRASYLWKCSGSSACQILRRLQPYLVIKSHQAALALEFQDRLNAYNGGRWNEVTEDELAWRDLMKAQISYANRVIVMEPRACLHE